MSRRLSKRLQAIYSMVDDGVFVADVGSDHAHLVLELVEKGKIPYAQAIENKGGPFINMKSNVAASPEGYRIACSLSDGLSALSPDAECVVIAGMGGRLAYSILEKGKGKLERVSSIIIDAHRDLPFLRQKVALLGYFIEDERLVYEDKVHYTIVKFRRGQAPQYGQADLLFGPVLRKSRPEGYLEWLQGQKRKVGELLDKGLSEQKRQACLSLYRLIKEEIQSESR